MFRIIILLSKAIVRDQRLRRQCMLWLVGVAVVMIFLGSLLSESWARAHVGLFAVYWVVCGWLTLTGVLLALLDILVIRAAGRATRRLLERQFAEENLKQNKQ